MSHYPKIACAVLSLLLLLTPSEGRAADPATPNSKKALSTTDPKKPSREGVKKIQNSSVPVSENGTTSVSNTKEEGVRAFNESKVGWGPNTRPLGDIHLLIYEGIINPVASELFLNALADAEEANAEAFILQLDTPGGLDTSMREMIKAIVSSSVPVVVHVYPSGGRAASAGAFLLLASHIAAMAPGTNVGAAHPVNVGGQPMDDEMKKKVENDAAAYIRSLAEQRGRDPQWAESAVRQSVSITEKEALALKIIDFIVEDTPGLIQQIHGREVTTSKGKRILSTTDAKIIKTEIGLRHKLLSLIADPNVVYILMLLGTTGLLAEMYSPGAIFPGVIGAICLILSFYSFQTLPVNYAGVALIVLAVVLFIAEVLVQGFGVLALGGITSLLIGSLMLFDSRMPALAVSPSVIFSSVFTIALLFGFIVRAAWRAQKTGPAREGGEEGGVLGEVGIAQSNLAPLGSIMVHGEIWQAEAIEPISAGDKVEIIERVGLKLWVRKPVYEEEEEKEE
jgi:membrane-bound serine protease (ClpP class)